MFPFNRNLIDMLDEFSCRNVKEVPLSWRLFIIALFTYIVIALLAIGYLTSNIFNASGDPAGVVTEESVITYVQKKSGFAQKPDGDAEHTLSAGSAADSDLIDFDWTQWLALDRV